MVMKRIAIIPARGGSKRIPKKNIINFQGQPMISWTIQAALDSGCFEEVLVSTDSEEIANIAIIAGASVPFLRNENADDFVPVSHATISALKQAETHWQTNFSEVVQLMPNCPLRNAEHIRDAIRHFIEQKIDYQISCFRFGWMNPWWAVSLDDDFLPKHIFSDAKMKRSQDLDQLYCPSGAIWIARRDSLLEAETFYGPGHRFFPMKWEAAVDIDDMDDYRMALAASCMIEQGDSKLYD
jgi:CMP-N-acetylneuraminic acid synthetase